MSEQFDPYYLWLGIPPQEQPPNHYRLLGIPLRESDPRVIEAAADRQMTFLRTFQTGKHAALSQRLLNEVAQARVCLLNAQKKAEYDRSLPSPAAETSAAAATQANAWQPPVAPIPQIATRPEPLAQRSKPASIWKGPVLFGAVASLTVVALLVWLVAGSGRGTSVEPRQAARANVPRDNSASRPAVPSLPALPAEPVASPAEPIASPEPGTPTAPAEAAPLPATPAEPATEPPPVGKNRLLMLASHGGETGTFLRALESYGLEGEVSKEFDKHRNYLAEYQTILTGSNWFDHYAKDGNKQPEAFANIQSFVEQGGHLVVFGSFNGRSMGNLKRFGITTGTNHNSLFEPVPGVSELFFAGSEALVPPDGRLRSAGHLRCSVPHVVLLKRGKGHRAGEPAVLTLEHKKGRVTATMCEPHWQKDYWLITVMVGWIARGCPTPESLPASASP